MKKIIPSIYITVRKHDESSPYEVHEMGDAHARVGTWEKTHDKVFERLPAVFKYLHYLVRQEAYKNARLEITIQTESWTQTQDGFVLVVPKNGFENIRKAVGKASNVRVIKQGKVPIK